MSVANKKMFDSIALKYDRINTLFSFGIDKFWRRSAVILAMAPKSKYNLLDIATGTGDLAFGIWEMAKKQNKDIKIIGIDQSTEMLKIAIKKAKAKKIKINFELGDALSLKYPDNSFEVVTNSMALRNFDDKKKFFSEAYRVLKPGGELILVDTAKPCGILSKAFFGLYFKLLTFEGAFINRSAYSFMVNSIMKSDRMEIKLICKRAGFSNVKIKNLFTGLPFVLTARKN